MAEFQEIEIVSWVRLTEIASRLVIGPPLKTMYVFRGQSVDWSLESRLTRILEAELRLEDIYAIERDAQEKFENQAHLFLPPSLSRLDLKTGSGVMLMQHYGVPTRMLDWTGSIYVAAYFAVSELQYADSDGVIWLFHSHSVSEASSQKFGEVVETRKFKQTYQLEQPKPDIRLLGMLRQAPRIASQQSALTVSRDPRTIHGDALRDLVEQVDSDKIIGAKLIIKAHCKEEIQRQLHAANMNSFTLFPGLDGLGKSVADSMMRSIKITANEIRLQR